MTNKKNSPKLIILDCDGVIYDESELDQAAQVAAVKATYLEYFSDTDTDIATITKQKKEKPVGGIYNYLENISKKIGISPESFMTKVIEHIDYSHISPDKDNILKKIQELQQKYKICMCSNNSLMHIAQIFKIKFNINADQLPFEVFDMRFASKNGIYYSKESDIFISKLEKHFNMKASDFLWIDDSQCVLDKVKTFGCHGILVSKENRLIDILNKL